MNKDLSKLTKDLVLNPVSAFKQDPKLVTAIDKLWRQQVASLSVEDGKLLLPQRKLDFTEVQNMIIESAKPKGAITYFTRIVRYFSAQSETLDPIQVLFNLKQAPISHNVCYNICVLYYLQRNIASIEREKR